MLAVPVVGSIGFAGLTSQAALLTATFFAGFIVLGIQIGINVVGAMLYPTSLRANGSGWQFGLGRIGSIVGPLLGALFVGMPVQQLYMWSALPFAAGAIVCFAIHRAQHGAARGAPGTGEGAVGCMRDPEGMRAQLSGIRITTVNGEPVRTSAVMCAGASLRSARGMRASKRFVAAQRRDHLLAEQADRAHQIGSPAGRRN